MENEATTDAEEFERESAASLFVPPKASIDRSTATSFERASAAIESPSIGLPLCAMDFGKKRAISLDGVTANAKEFVSDDALFSFVERMPPHLLVTEAAFLAYWKGTNRSRDVMLRWIASGHDLRFTDQRHTWKERVATGEGEDKSDRADAAAIFRDTKRGVRRLTRAKLPDVVVEQPWITLGLDWRPELNAWRPAERRQRLRGDFFHRNPLAERQLRGAIVRAVKATSLFGAQQRLFLELVERNGGVTMTGINYSTSVDVYQLALCFSTTRALVDFLKPHDQSPGNFFWATIKRRWWVATKQYLPRDDPRGKTNLAWKATRALVRAMREEHQPAWDDARKFASSLDDRRSFRSFQAGTFEEVAK